MHLSTFFQSPQLVRDGEFAHLDETGTRQGEALVFSQNLQYLQLACGNPHVSCIMTTPALANEVKAKGLVAVEDPRLEFFRLYVRLLQEQDVAPPMTFGRGRGGRIHPSAVVSDKTLIGDNVTIGAAAVIEDYTVIGHGSYIGAGVVVGAEGLQTIREPSGTMLVVPHGGGVEIGNNVVILANSVVAKSLYRTFTRIGDNSQIGILSNIGHGAQIGAGCVISGNCVVAGRTEVGDRSWLGASSSIAQGLRIGTDVKIKMGSVVVSDIADGETVSGNFAMRHGQHMRNYLKAQRP